MLIGDGLDPWLVVLLLLGIKPDNSLPQMIRAHFIGLQFGETTIPLPEEPLFDLSQSRGLAKI